MEMWNIIFYKRENGTRPVDEFIKQLPQKHFAKAIKEIKALRIYGNQWKYPHVSHIDGKLWELRIKSASDISRIFYFFHVDNNIVLLHGFVKKTQKTPQREIERAKHYLDDYLRSQNNENT